MEVLKQVLGVDVAKKELVVSQGSMKSDFKFRDLCSFLQTLEIRSSYVIDFS